MNNLENNRTRRMAQIKDEVVNLKQSPLYQWRVKPVIGEGSHYAKIMFVGEAPGRNESETGRPFCGAAGKVLDELLASIALKREDVYITNIVKDRPPQNRDPLPEEIKLYAPFLERQIEIIQPRIVVALGRFSMAYIMNKFDLAADLQPIGKIHGKAFTAQAPYGEVMIVALYHPAVALYNGKMREVLKEDFKILDKILKNHK